MDKLLSLGVPMPDVRSALTVLLAGVLCIPFRYIHGFKTRLIVDLVCGILLSVISSGYWGLISLSTTLLTYFALKFLDNPSKLVETNNKQDVVSDKTNGKNETSKKVTFSMVSKYVVLANFLLLFILQIFKRRKSKNALSPSLFYNWISQQMILFQKLVALALNSSESFVAWTSSKEERKAMHGQHKVQKLPSLLVLLGYCFTTNGSLAGGYVELSSYLNWLREKNHHLLKEKDSMYLPWPQRKEVSDGGKKMKVATQARKEHSLLWEHGMTVRGKANMLYLFNYLSGLLWLVVYAGLGGMARRFLQIGTVEYGDELRAASDGTIISKILLCIKTALYLDFGCTLFRTKYYFVWKMFRAITLGNYFAVAESTHNKNKEGKKSTDKDKKELTVTYDVAKNIDIQHCEFALSSREAMSNWNINATNWFRRYIYMALTSQTQAFYGKREIATILTNATSAMWHGISSGYYMFFVGFSLNVIVGRLRYVYIDSLFKELARCAGKNGKVIENIYSIICIVSARIERSLFLPYFILLSLLPGIRYTRNVYFAPFIWLVTRWTLFRTVSFIPVVKRISAKHRNSNIMAKRDV